VPILKGSFIFGQDGVT